MVVSRVGIAWQLQLKRGMPDLQRYPLFWRVFNHDNLVCKNLHVTSTEKPQLKETNFEKKNNADILL